MGFSSSFHQMTLLLVSPAQVEMRIGIIGFDPQLCLALPDRVINATLLSISPAQV